MQTPTTKCQQCGAIIYINEAHNCDDYKRKASKPKEKYMDEAKADSKI